MRRDQEYLRQLLFKYENADGYLIVDAMHMGANQEEQQEHFHLMLLADENYVVSVGRGTYRLTAQGLNFIDAIRDDGMWAETKKAAANVGTVSLAVLKDIAIALAKAKISKVIGIQL